MSLFFRREKRAITDLDAFVSAYSSYGGRLTSSTAAPVTRTTSLQSSVTWACQRLRADLISTTPLDVFRAQGTGRIEVPKPAVLVSPDGKIDITEWLASSQMDLDAVGNTFALILSRDRLGKPAMLEPLPVESVVVRVREGVVSYEVGGSKVDTADVWHERQFTTSGSPVGLSPLAFGVLAMGGYLSAQQFAADWFSGSAIPAAHFKNVAKEVTAEQSTLIKARFNEMLTTGGLLVTGNDWEYSMVGAKASESGFAEMLKLSALDLCRFYGVPADLVDVESTSGSITYANVTQRNLQLLTLNLGPVFVRRERAFSNGLTPRGQFVKFNTDALLRMDPSTRSALYAEGIDSRRLTVTEARALENQPPLTPEDEAEFARLFPAKTTPTGVPNA